MKLRAEMWGRFFVGLILVGIIFYFVLLLNEKFSFFRFVVILVLGAAIFFLMRSIYFTARGRK